MLSSLKKPVRFPVSAHAGSAPPEDLSPRSAARRFHLALNSLLLALALLSSAAARAQAAQSIPSAPTPQDVHRFDVGLSGFGQVSAASNGNFVREDTTESLGGIASFRQPYRPWAGYEINYGYTRFSESYNKAAIAKVQNNVHEFTAAYLLQTRTTYYGFQPFLTVGTGLIMFQPTSKGGSGRSTQVLPLFVYSVGLNRPMLSNRFGIRVQYLALEYKTPNFNEVLLDSHTLRTTMEPSIGAYYRF